MKKRIEEVINHVQKSSKVSDETKPLILEKLEEWKEEDDAISEVSLKFEKWWLEMEPVFAELGWI